MQPALVDTHAHLMDEAFADDLPAALERAQAAGVAEMVCVGYDLATSRAAVELASRYPKLRAAVGIHPNDASLARAGDFEEIAELARSPVVVGIGETGLDYYRTRTPPERQREALSWHLELAREVGLPVVIHNRDADEDVATLLEAYAARVSAGVPGVLHCYSSTDLAYLRRLLAAGFVVSFAGPLTFKANGPLREIAAHVPLDRLVVETDCPFLAPQRYRGRRNEPAYVRETALVLAEIHGLELSTLAPHLWSNAHRLFPGLGAERVGERAA
jgi:TatD DNase family protein